jgi:two-component system, LytTR family, response regulator
MRCLIIDDEPLARDLVRKFVGDFPDMTVLGECSDGFQGLKSIQELQPDLVFLDVQMPKITGFEMLELMEAPPIIIFTTAYNEYAIKAFEMNAVDYLLKPFSKERFKKAIEKATEAHLSKSKPIKPLQDLQNDTTHLQEPLQRVVVKNGAKIQVIPVAELVYLEAQDDYVMLYTASAKYLKQQTMKYFEKALAADLFVRIHRSYIVNVSHIAQLEHYDKESFKLILTNKTVLPLSKTGYVELKKVLGL